MFREVGLNSLAYSWVEILLCLNCFQILFLIKGKGRLKRDFKIYNKAIKVTEADPDLLQQESSTMMSFCIYSLASGTEEARGRALVEMR